MINYVNLPNYTKTFIKEFDYDGLTKEFPYIHAWRFVPMDVVLTNEAKQWFNDKKIALYDDAVLFKLPKNYNGPIHVDKMDPSDCAFNFVVSGYGQMQWVTNLKAVEWDQCKDNGTYYSRFLDIKSFDISDVWTGDAGLVKINIPHRIVTTDSERICLSVRIKKYVLPNTFDEIVKLF